ncbi:endonuclease [Sphingomonas metalli]|uniref:Endonuclease n=1 Tax=Sphingomonas metalli TaxID=1779358 RepID=A0A916SVM2_9SPHN|nr:GIY-YIG nuclease family protein [Sphingomonas metalli]GGB18612.1 endonuclease [Sphingomonas metalli]
MRGGWVYIVASAPRGMLYIGVTAHLAARIDQHRRDVGSAFCRRFGIRTLVLAEPYDTIEDAIVREKRLKAWKRDWKIRLIEQSNPEWRDLFDLIA